MSRNPYTRDDGPPAGWTNHHQLLWLQPDDDPFGEPYEDLYSVIDGAGAKRIAVPRAPVDTWPPLVSTPPETLTRPAAALTSNSDAPAGSSGQGA